MKSKSIGSLRGDLSEVAERVCKAARDSMVAVWVSDHAEVYADRGDSIRDVHTPWMVGIYSMGMNSCDIVDDLLEVRRERLKAGVLD
jgi:hypothetical protein